MISGRILGNTIKKLIMPDEQILPIAEELKNVGAGNRSQIEKLRRKIKTKS